MPDPGVHRAMRMRIPAYRLGLLDEATALDLRHHLRECAPCREAFEPYTELSDEEIERLGHLSLGLLSRWDHVTSAVPSEARALLEAHLAQCASCRESRDFARSMRASRRPRARSKAWLGFGTAALAAAAAVIMLRTREPRVLAPAPTSQPRAALPEAARPAPGAHRSPRRAAPTLALGGTVRGGGDTIVRVPAGTTVLPLRVPPLLGVGPDARIRIQVDGPDGSIYGKNEVAHRKLFGTSMTPSLEAHAPDGPLPAGHYRVEVISDIPDPALPGSFERADYDFDVRLTGK